MDVWRTDEASEFEAHPRRPFRAYHCIKRANGYPAPVVGEWTRFDITLADFTGLTSTSEIDTIVLSSHEGGLNSGETLYIDNLYVSKPEPDYEVTFAPDDDPGFELGNVVGGTASVFSGRGFPAGGDAPAVLLNKPSDEPGIGVSFLTIDSGELITSTSSQVSMRVYLKLIARSLLISS